jgi:hypothetical protein
MGKPYPADVRRILRLMRRRERNEGDQRAAAAPPRSGMNSRRLK